MFDSLVFDYADAGQKVSLQGRIGAAVVTRPHALRHILVNLADLRNLG